MLIKVPVCFNLVLLIYPSYGPWKSLKSPWIWFWQMGKNPVNIVKSKFHRTNLWGASWWSCRHFCSVEFETRLTFVVSVLSTYRLTHSSLIISRHRCMSLGGWRGAAPQTRAKPLFFGQKLNFSDRSQKPKMEKMILYLLNEKAEFILSDEIKCSKSGIFTNNYWVGWVGQSNFAS